MIVAFKHEDMSPRHLGKFYDNLASFARTEFDIKISEEGVVTIDGEVADISYRIGKEGDDTTKYYNTGEALHHYYTSRQFKSHAKRHFWTVYQIKEKIV